MTHRNEPDFDSSDDGVAANRPLHPFPKPLFFVIVVWFGHALMIWYVATQTALVGAAWWFWIFLSLLGGLFFVPALRLLLGKSRSTNGMSIGSIAAFTLWLLAGSVLSRGGAWVCCGSSLFLFSMLMAAIVADDQREAYALWREDCAAEQDD